MAEARIVDRGYRAYEGERRGLRGAVTSLVVHSVQRVLGLKRPFRYKVLPILAAALAFIPALVFVGLAAFLPEPLLDALPTYAESYGFIVAAIVVFAAFVAPELLCTDRRSGMLGLYLASPLNRDSYLGSKAIAVLGLLAIVTLGPPLLMLTAFIIEGVGPDGPGDFLVVLVRMIGAGAVVAALYGGLTLAVSSFTDRRAFASAGIILILIASGIVTTALIDGAGFNNHLYLANLFALPFEAVFRIYGEVAEDPSDRIENVSTAAVFAATAAWTFVFAAIVRFRYQRLQVTR